MNKTSRIYLLIFSLMITSCSRLNVIPTSVDTSSFTNSIVSSSTNSSFATTTTTDFSLEEYIPEYVVNQTFLNVTFEDVFYLCEERAGVDLDELAQNSVYNGTVSVYQDNLEIVYIPDYSVFLESVCRTDPDSGISLYSPEEYEYHILRRIYINGLAIDEFEDDYWAKVEYCKAYDYFIEDCRVLDESNLFNGYYYSYRENCLKYAAYYVSNNCVVYYTHSLNQPDNSDFITYLEICDRSGLPTSSEMTDAIVA